MNIEHSTILFWYVLASWSTGWAVMFFSKEVREDEYGPPPLLGLMLFTSVAPFLWFWVLGKMCVWPMVHFAKVAGLIDDTGRARR